MENSESSTAAEPSKPSIWKLSCGGTEKDRRNQRRIRFWLRAWMGSWLGVTALTSFEVLPQGPLATTAALASAALGLVALAAYRRFLREADELRRKIELESLAAAFGIGVLGGLTLWLLERTGALVSADLLWVVVAMLVAHGLGTWIGLRRYS